MKSFFEGNLIGGAKHHMVQYYDGQRIREVTVLTHNGEIMMTESEVFGILKPGTNYRNALRRLARYEDRCRRPAGW